MAYRSWLHCSISLATQVWLPDMHVPALIRVSCLISVLHGWGEVQANQKVIVVFEVSRNNSRDINVKWLANRVRILVVLVFQVENSLVSNIFIFLKHAFYAVQASKVKYTPTWQCTKRNNDFFHDEITIYNKSKNFQIRNFEGLQLAQANMKTFKTHVWKQFWSN